MKILIYIFKIIINIIYTILKLFPTKNKIIFISRQMDRSNINYNILINRIKNDNPDTKIIISCKRINKNIKGYIIYSFHLLKEMYHLATSKVAILDTYSITVSNLHHKKKLTIIQMWHAMGALKKFGYSILDTKEGSNKKLAYLMNMHKNYDYVMASSNECAKYFAEAFNTDINKIFIDPLPVVDRLVNKDYQQEVIDMLKQEYPILKKTKKKIILYCPTFRKNNKDSKKIQDLIDNIDFNKYELIIKLHPNSKVNVKDKRVIIDNRHTTIKFAFLADYIITDYSAIVFELSLLNKPIYFYTYDYNEYVNNRDFYIDFKKSMPGLISDDSKNIVDAIEHNKYDLNKIKRFSKKYIDIPKEGCTQKLLNLIYNFLK